MRYEKPGGRQSRYAKEREEDSAYTLAHAPVLFLQAEGPACAASSVLSPKYEVFCRRLVGCFSRRERSTHI